MSEPASAVDLHTALDGLRERGELVVIEEPVGLGPEIARRYATFAGVPASPPTAAGPAMLFTNVGPSRRAVTVGVFGTRQRLWDHLGVRTAPQAHELVTSAARSPIAAVVVPEEDRISYGADVGAMPIPIITTADAGPYVTMGVVVARDPITGERNLSVHRMCVKGSDRLTVWVVPGRDLGKMLNASWARGASLPITVNIGLDPAVYVAAALTGLPAPPGRDELGVAGALRRRSIRLACGNDGAQHLVGADWVIHGVVSPGPVPEGKPGSASMPEFLGYAGSAHPGLPIIEVTDITSRPNPIYQTVVGPGLEQSVLLGLGMEVDILWRLREYGITWAVDTHASTAGGGQLLVVVAADPPDAVGHRATVEACQRLLAEMRMVKVIILVNPDVAVDNHTDLWWAVTTRAVPARDVIVEADAPGFPLDPSQGPDGAPGAGGPGRTSKLLIDALVPCGKGSTFRRVQLGV